jgi:DNA-binding NtrC family response regulator
VNSVLIVDDEILVREMLVRLLRTENYIVHEAADAEAALAVFSTAPISVLICDRKMPGRDGDWLVIQVRDRFPETAVILASGDDAIPPSISLQPGVVAYLVKPFAADTVRNAVRDAMVWHQAAVRNRGQR